MKLWRAGLVLAACALLLVCAGIACAAPPGSTRMPIASVSRAVSDPFVPHVPFRALAYQRAGRILGLLATFWNLLGLWLLLRSGLSARLRDAALRVTRADFVRPGSLRFLFAVALYFTAYTLLIRAWALPFGLADFALEHHYGFSRQTPVAFLFDVLLDAGFALLSIPLVWGGYWLYSRSPRHWWQWLWLLAVTLLFAQIVLQPVLIAPAYNRYTPLAAGPLRDKILALAAKAGITGGRVFVENTSARTNHVNAYVTGLGPTTRIVLNDTALRLLPQDQILAMVGHEMGHYVEGHIWVFFVANALGAGAFLWLAARLLPWLARRKASTWRLCGVDDLAALPMIYLLLSVFLLIQSPIEAGLSRTLEHRADAFGLRMTHLNDATARLMVGFAERDYADPNPPPLLQFWFGTHPTLSERIAFARHFPRAVSASPRK